MENSATSILTQRPDQLAVTKELTQFMYNRNFKNLNDLLEYHAGDLLKMEGFGYRCLISLYQLLQKNGCERLLKE